MMQTRMQMMDEDVRKTNLKALGLTALVCGLIVLICLLVSWTHMIAPAVASVADDGGLEVNLGNADQGWGDEAPMVPGDPGEISEASSDAAQTADASTEEDEASTYKEVAENNDAEAPTVRTSLNPKRIINTKTTDKKSNNLKNKNIAPVANVKKNTKQSPVQNASAAPITPKAKALYQGGHGNGGNGADSYNGVRNQGVAGGRGDQGKPGGNPNSDSYDGSGSGSGGRGNGSGRAGVSISEGLNGRHLFSASFKDKFNQPAKVAVRITVDASGKVISASISPRGTTTTDANIRSIARRRAMQLKFSSGSEQQSGTVLFNFKVNE